VIQVEASSRMKWATARLEVASSLGSVRNRPINLTFSIRPLQHIYSLWPSGGSTSTVTMFSRHEKKTTEGTGRGRIQSERRGGRGRSRPLLGQESADCNAKKVIHMCSVWRCPLPPSPPLETCIPLHWIGSYTNCQRGKRGKRRRRG